MLKPLLAGALALAPSSVTPSIPTSPSNAIVRVICPVAGGYKSGTAFRVGNGLALSVNHVTHSGGCQIDGAPVKLIYESPDRDFSMLAFTDGPAFAVDCGGFVKGREYRAIGYARGLPSLTAVDLVAAGTKSGQWSVLYGIMTVIPGMSGGVIIDRLTGRAVGMINVSDFQRGMSGSVALGDTPVCAHA